MTTVASDWLGLVFFVCLAVAAYVGLRSLSRKKTRTSEEFEKNAAEGTLVGAGMNALHEVLNPAEARAKEVKMELKGGSYDKKRREGKANGDE